jgi:hypothetical protein
VGRIDGEVVREQDLLNVFAAQFRTLETQEFELKKRALDEVFPLRSHSSACATPVNCLRSVTPVPHTHRDLAKLPVVG